MFERDGTMEVPLPLDICFDGSIEECRPADSFGENTEAHEAALLVVVLDHLVVDGFGSRDAGEEYAS